MLQIKLRENEAIKGTDFTIALTIYDGGVEKTPSSATISVYDYIGNAFVEDEDMAISGNTCTYTLSSDYTNTLQENARIKVVIDGEEVNFLFDIVLYKLINNVTDDDLKKYKPTLASDIWTGHTNYQAQIDEAFNLVKRDIKNMGKRPNLIIDSSQIRELIILRAFSIIFNDFSSSPEDIWYARYLSTQEEYKRALDNTVFKYDEDEDGIVNSDDEVFGQPRLQR